MSQETFVKPTDTVLNNAELIAAQPKLLELIAALDNNPKTLATGTVQYEWGTRNGKRLEAEDSGNFTVDNTVTTFGHNDIDTSTRRVQDVSVKLANPPRQIPSIEGHIVGLAYDAVTEGIETTYFRSVKALKSSRIDTVRYALKSEDELTEVSRVFDAAIHEIEGL